MPDYDDHDDTQELPSKSELKRRMTALQELGEALAALGDKQLARIPIEDDELLKAIHEVRNIRSNSARRRHMQYIGKLMRKADPAPIREALSALGADDRRAKRIFRDAELWRERLQNDGDAALAAFCESIGRECPAVADELAAWRRSAGDRERKTASRRLFRAIHQEIAGNVQRAARSI